MLPIEIQMQIDLTVAAHKREVAEGFARLRAKLLPEPPEPGPLQRLMNAMMNASSSQMWLQNQLMPSQLQHKNIAYVQNDWFCGMGGAARTGVFGGLF